MPTLIRSFAPALLAALLAPAAAGTKPTAESYFERIATFPVFLNAAIDVQTVAEIVAASEDGNTLIYTDSEHDRVGFVDIADPEHPAPLGVLDLSGEPTSVAVRGRHALVAVNTSADFVNTSGELAVIDIANRTLAATLPLGGQPDSVAVSPDGRFAAVAASVAVLACSSDSSPSCTSRRARPPRRVIGLMDAIVLRTLSVRWSKKSV